MLGMLHALQGTRDFDALWTCSLAATRAPVTLVVLKMQVVDATVPAYTHMYAYVILLVLM